MSCSLLILAVVSCALALALTPWVKRSSIRLGLVDRPDNVRKVHKNPTPRTGGLAILLSYLGAYGVLFVLPLSGGGLIGAHSEIIARLLPPVAIVFLIGLLDDTFELLPWQKLAGQIAAAGLVYVAGVRIERIANISLPDWCSCLLTIMWLVLCCNAFNLIDGMDGLAAGVGLTATATTFTAGILHGDLALGLATAPLAGALIGFLKYNFAPASIFLGDCGSLLIGFLLGAYGIIWTQKSATMLGMAAPAMMLALPLLEVGLSILRRFLRNEPIFTGDRGHIHHRLLDRGFSPRGVALMLYGVCGLGAVLSLLQTQIRREFGGVLILLCAAAAWIGVRYLNYAEFAATRRFLSSTLRPTLGAHIELQSLKRSLEEAANIEQCWQALETSARALGYSGMVARLCGAQFFTTRPGRPGHTWWQMRLNLPNGDFVNITQVGSSSAQPILVVPFIDLVRQVLPAKLAQLGCVRIGAETDAISLVNLAGALDSRLSPQRGPRNSSTKTVISSDCGAPSVNAATAS